MIHTGDLWQLGEHCLLIGDATSSSDVARLTRHVGQRAHAIITDPPYGLLRASWDHPTFGFIPHLQSFCENNATCMIFCSLPFGFTLHQAMLQHHWVWRWNAIWSKRNGGFIVSKKQPIPCHEHLFAYAHPDHKIAALTFNGYDAGETLAPWGDRCETGGHGAVYDKGIYKKRLRQGRTDGKRWIRSVLDGKKKNELPPSERTPHPSQKPLDLVEKLVLLITQESQIIYDCFLGSGTTLLACEKHNRQCAGIELLPEHGSLILDRWQRATGKQARLVQRVAVVKEGIA